MTDTTNTNPAPETVTNDGAPEGHEAAMLARFEQSQLPTEDTKPAEPAKAGDEAPQRPEWIPEKFWKDGKADYEGLAKSYAELEKKVGAPKEEPKAPEGKPDETQKAAEDAVKAAGLDFNSLTAKYETTGTIEPTDYEALAKAGISKEMVDQYIAGTEALKDQRRTTIFNEVGGQQNYEASLRWAATSMAPEEINAFNAVMDSGDLAAMKLAAAGLYTRYTKAEGSRPNLLTAANTPSAGDVFRSTAELTSAMSDPRYQTDEAYRQSVADKLGRSNLSF
jgi:hypothetical protein